MRLPQCVDDLMRVKGVPARWAADHGRALLSGMTSAAEHADEAVTALQRTAGFLRTELAHRMQLYSVPQLHFVYDDSIESGMRMSQLIDDALASDRKSQS